MDVFDINKVHENTKENLCACYGDITAEYDRIKQRYEKNAVIDTFIPIFVEREIKERYETI